MILYRTGKWQRLKNISHQREKDNSFATLCCPDAFTAPCSSECWYRECTIRHSVVSSTLPELPCPCTLWNMFPSEELLTYEEYLQHANITKISAWILNVSIELPCAHTHPKPLESLCHYQWSFFFFLILLRKNTYSSEKEIFHLPTIHESRHFYWRRVCGLSLI